MVSSSCHNNIYSLLQTYTNTPIVTFSILCVFAGAYVIAGVKHRNIHTHSHKHVKSFCRKIMHTAKQCFRNWVSNRSKWKVKSRVNNRFNVKTPHTTHTPDFIFIFILCGCIYLTENAQSIFFYVSANEHVTCNISISMHHDSGWLVGYFIQYIYFHTI